MKFCFRCVLHPLDCLSFLFHRFLDEWYRTSRLALTRTLEICSPFQREDFIIESKLIFHGHRTLLFQSERIHRLIVFWPYRQCIDVRMQMAQYLFISVVLVEHNAKEFIGVSPSSYQFWSLDENPHNKRQQLKSFNKKTLFRRDLQMIEEQKFDKYERSDPSDIVNTFTWRCTLFFSSHSQNQRRRRVVFQELNTFDRLSNVFRQDLVRSTRTEVSLEYRSPFDDRVVSSCLSLEFFFCHCSTSIFVLVSTSFSRDNCWVWDGKRSLSLLSRTENTLWWCLPQNFEERELHHRLERPRSSPIWNGYRHETQSIDGRSMNICLKNKMSNRTRVFYLLASTSTREKSVFWDSYLNYRTSSSSESTSMYTTTTNTTRLVALQIFHY